MVDAAVGGKTGINTAAGKNLVGAFHEPAGVLCDLDLLARCRAPELVAGLGEVVKCGFIADPEILDLVERDPAAALDRRSGACASWSSGRSGQDRRRRRRPQGDRRRRRAHPGREVLNYGHTLAHAIEKADGLRVRHGEAVALGHGATSPSSPGSPAGSTTRSRRGTRRCSAAVGLPTSLRRARRSRSCSRRCGSTRRRAATQLRFVVLDGLARPAILAGPSEADCSARRTTA